MTERRIYINIVRTHTIYILFQVVGGKAGKTISKLITNTRGNFKNLGQ